MNKRIQQRQKGASLLFTLIALLILLAAALAVARSMQTSLSNAGNLAFRRDLINHAEQALATAISQEYNYQGSSAAQNYSASILPANNQGIPIALLTTNGYEQVASKTLQSDDESINIRYIVERLCEDSDKTANDQGKEKCLSMHREVKGGSHQQAQGATSPLQPIYRVSAKVTGPRNTEVFIQSTFTKDEAYIEPEETSNETE